MPAVLRRLPGIAFETTPPPLDDALPRMDVAGFVGLARTGPVGVPVVVHDPVEFAAVFGDAPVLLRAAATGERVTGLLADAVGAFFRNGGRRCWVVRVSAATEPATVAVPGLVRLDGAGRPVPVQLPAAAVGRWADELAATAGVLRAALPAFTLDSCRLPAGTDPGAVRGRLAAPGAVRVGDLVGVTYGDRRLTFAVSEVAGTAVAGTAPLCVSTAPYSGKATRAGTPVTVVGRTRPGGPDLLRFAAPVPDLPAPGALVPLDLLPESGAPEDAALLVTGPPRVARDLPGRLHRFVVPAAEIGVAAPAAVLTLELRTRVGAQTPVAVRDLGFVPGHPRYVGALPTDEQLHRVGPTTDDPRPPQVPPLWTDVASPRFPLAGFTGGAPVIHPFGVDAFPELLFVPARRPAEHSADDLLTDFAPGLFLDPALAGAGADTLLATADFVRDTGPRPRPLTGIHALLDVAEVTLVAVPDAVHRVWEPAAPLPALPAPGHEPYVPPRPCPHGDAHTFADCAGTDLTLPAEPVLAAEPDDLGIVHVTWKPLEDPEAPVRYVLEESTDAASWAGARELYRGTGTEVVLYGRSPGTYFYRVRAEDDAGRASTWSEGRAVPVLLDDPGAQPAAFVPTVVRAVHVALLHMCAARGDLLVVLALPQHYRAADVEAHVAAVRETVAPGGRSDDRVLSFGALHHPWVHVDRPIPPDGPATGVLAGTALRRGCWVAPANMPLTGVVALAPAPPAADLQRLQDTAANTVRQVPRGFLWLSADTLCTDPDLSQVTVRRLLSLLRRTALDRGPAHTFEPLGEVLRRQVRRQFEAVLNRLLAGGAFAGPGPAESFRVTVDDPGGDTGQLVVELKVAPSVPLRFLTVRLVQAGDGGLSVEGV